MLPSFADDDGPSRRSFLITAAGGVLLAALPHGSKAESPRPQALPKPVMPAQSLRFDVLYLGDVIGSHLVDFAGSGDRFSANTKIDIRVKILGATLFDYQNQCTERWRDGKLQTLNSVTRDEGRDFLVTGKADATGFVIETRKGRITAPQEIMASTYWSEAQLARTRIIDTKRGTLKEQQVLSRTPAVIEMAGDKQEVTRIEVKGVIDGAIFYDGIGRWVGAAFRRRGADIVYRLKR